MHNALFLMRRPKIRYLSEHIGNLLLHSRALPCAHGPSRAAYSKSSELAGLRAPLSSLRLSRSEGSQEEPGKSEQADDRLAVG